MKFVYDDGGRAKAGYVGHTTDCVCRAITIATELPYQTVYDMIDEAGRHERKSKRRQSGKSSARSGVYKATRDRLIKGLGWKWIPTMSIGSGCRVHLKADELPAGRLIVRVSKHLVAVIDGVIHDTGDCSRNETRCVYGYYAKA